MELLCSKRQIAVIGVIIVGCIALFAGVFGSWRAGATSAPWIEHASPPVLDVNSTIEINLKITSFSISGDLGVAVQIVGDSPYSTYPDIADLKGRLNQDVCVAVGSESTCFKNGTDISRKWTTNIPMDELNVQLYPLDYYKVNLDMNIWCPSVNDAKDCDLAFTIKTRTIPSYDFKFDITPPKNVTTDWGSRAVTLTVTRSSLIYQGFLLVAFWVIMIIEISMMILYTVCDAKLETAILGLTNGFMFALPAIRNSAPFNPPLGTQLDYAGFYWAMLVAVLSFTIVAAKYILGLIKALPQPPEKKAEQVSEKKLEEKFEVKPEEKNIEDKIEVQFKAEGKRGSLPKDKE